MLDLSELLEPLNHADDFVNKLLACKPPIDLKLDIGPVSLEASNAPARFRLAVDLGRDPERPLDAGHQSGLVREEVNEYMTATRWECNDSLSINAPGRMRDRTVKKSGRGRLEMV